MAGNNINTMHHRTANHIRVRARGRSNTRDPPTHPDDAACSAKPRPRSSSNCSGTSAASGSTTVSNIIANMLMISRSRDVSPGSFFAGRSAAAEDPPDDDHDDCGRAGSGSSSRERALVPAPPTPPPPPPKPKLSPRLLRGRSKSRARTSKAIVRQDSASLARFRERKDSSFVPVDRVSHGSSSRRRNARSVQPLPLSVPKHRTDENPLPHRHHRGRSKTPPDRSRRKGKQRRSLTVDDLEPHRAYALFDESDQDLKEGKPHFGHFESSPSPSPEPERRRESNRTRSRSQSTDRLSHHKQPTQRGRSPSRSPSPDRGRGRSRSKSIDKLATIYKLVRHEREARLLRKGSGGKEKDKAPGFPALPYIDEKGKDDDKKSKQYGMRGRGRSVSREHVAALTSRSKSRAKSKSRKSHASSSRSSSRPPPSNPEIKFDSTDQCEKHPVITLTRKTILTSRGLETVRDTCPLCREEASEVAITNIHSVKKYGDSRRPKKSSSSSTYSLSNSIMDPESTAVSSLTRSHAAVAGDASTISNVLNMPYTTPLGETGWYTGQVDEFGKPHGEGVMRSREGYVTEMVVWCHGCPKHYLDNRWKSGGSQGSGGMR